MQFTFTNLIAVLAATAAATAMPATGTKANNAAPSPLGPAVGAPSPASEVIPLDFNVGAVWTNANKGGTAGFINVGGIPSGCRNFVSPFIDSISSLSVDKGFRCVFFIDANCNGASITVRDGAFVANLDGTNFQDSLSSFECFAN
ncbi:hypothetical protein QCA50_007856 [Cerrena zonata]|uniref:Uncharacterized protein n=1 Tax=Cerrena zonata TaxID=2478898 RepID=A0AAW0GDE0_9APHY